MLLSSTDNYKSIKPIHPAIELPDFVVISGLNGSGKTQLLDGIEDNKINLSDEGDRELKPLRLFGHTGTGLLPNNSAHYTVEMYRFRVKNFAGALRAYQQIPEEVREEMKEGGSIASRRPALDPQTVALLEKVARLAGKGINNLTEGDLYNHLPLEHAAESMQFHHQNFSAIFKQYHWKLHQNKFRRYLHQEHGETEFLTDEEFQRLHGEPPWLLVNQIIKEARLDYHTNTPEHDHPESDYTFKLINNLNGAEIDFHDLSSGERIIMSMALSLYNSDHDVVFPKVLLFDEPDAHLHPSMAKQFLDVIQNVFVSKKGVKVIMTTHSPSTVALAPDEALFIMNKTEPRLTKATKDGALGVLTSGVPALSINYENRRQVFVESKHDATMYGKLYEKLRDRLVPEVSIHFIPSGSGGNGSCQQVKEIVDKLTGYGNRSVYGIIDWDNMNSGNKFVKVLGEGKRYSLENYVFDPVILAAFLLRETFIDGVTLGLNKGERYIDFIKFDDDKLQSVADFIVDKVKREIGDPADTDFQETEYVGGRKIKLPCWFLRTQGHNLEENIKQLFPQLRKYRREGDLKRDVINKVVEDMPEFIPKDILLLFEDIQSLES